VRAVRFPTFSLHPLASLSDPPKSPDPSLCTEDSWHEGAPQRAGATPAIPLGRTQGIGPTEHSFRFPTVAAMNNSTYNSIALLPLGSRGADGWDATTQKPDKVPLGGPVGVLPSAPPEFTIAHRKI